MTPDEGIAAAVVADSIQAASKSTGSDLEAAGLSTGVLVLLAALWSLFGHYLSSRSRYLNESGTACLLGLGAGVLLLACRDHSNAGLVNGLLRFNSAAFFTYLLPPVIFYAGLSVEQRLFFSNLPSILSFGVLGTLISFILISAALYSLAGTTIGMDAQDCLALGAVFAATDSVAVLGLLDPRAQPQLFSLVFGEGIVNDATSVVLLGALARMARQQRPEPGQYMAMDDGGKFVDPADTAAASDPGVASLLGLSLRLMGNFGYLLLTSTCLGLAAGMGIVALLRGRVASQGPHHEMALVGLLSYLAYLFAEVLGLSAILSLFCCGVAVSHFALRSQHHAATGGGGGDDPSLHSVASDLPGISSSGASGTVSADVSNHLNDHNHPNHHHRHVRHEDGHGRLNGDAAGGGSGGGDPEIPDARTASTGMYGVHERQRVGEGAGAAGGGGNESAGRGVLGILAMPARRLAARAFGGSGGGGCMSAAGATTTINAFKSLSYVAEGLIFIYVGMDALDPVRWQASYPGEVIWLVGVLLLFMMAARAASVVPLSMLHNIYAPRHQRLSGKDMLVIWWSGLMRGAVSVALVYLNFDTADGSTPAAAAIISPRHAAAAAAAAAAAVAATGGVKSPAYNALIAAAEAGGRRHLFQADGAAAAAGGSDAIETAAATAAAIAAAIVGGHSGGGGDSGGEGAARGSNPDTAAAMALAAAIAEANELSMRQHATMIVATLLVVVASVLVVSTLTKPLLQGVMEADPRKSPLKVLSEALCDPWVEATWRLHLALGRSYRRWTTAGGADDVNAAADGGGAAAGGGGSRRTPAAASSGALTHTHTIPMSTLGLGSSGGSGPEAGSRGPGTPPHLALSSHKGAGGGTAASGGAGAPATTAAVAGTVIAVQEDALGAIGRGRGNLQQRSNVASAAAAAAHSSAAAAGGAPSSAGSMTLFLPPRNVWESAAEVSSGPSSQVYESRGSHGRL